MRSVDAVIQDRPHEIRFWSDYVTGGATADYIHDDEGESGGLPRGASFVIAGDQNADPPDGDSVAGAITQLLDNPRVRDAHEPTSEDPLSRLTGTYPFPTSDHRLVWVDTSIGGAPR